MFEPRRSGLRPILLAVTALATLALAPAARAEGSVSFLASPPMPGQAQYEAASRTLADQVNQPITGASTLPVVEGVEAPPSLEALQAARPGDQVGDGLQTGRAEVLRQAAMTYGAQGGLAARSFAINEMLRRYEAQLSGTYDFRPLVLPVGGGQTLMRPPIVSEAQMAFALGENGQVARETSCIFEITREAQLTSAPPDWRSYLVRAWGSPARPADAAAEPVGFPARRDPLDGRRRLAGNRGPLRDGDPGPDQHGRAQRAHGHRSEDRPHHEDGPLGRQGTGQPAAAGR